MSNYSETRGWVIDPFSDMIDSRDVVERISTLADDLAEGEDWARDEYDALCALAADCEGVSDWEFGETLIADSHFREFARELAEDCGMVPGQDWPLYCIDWDRAADELKHDYLPVRFAGRLFWVRY